MAPENLLLARFPVPLLERLRPRLETVRLDHGATLFDVGQPVRHGYFPTGGLLAIEIASDDGHALELAAVGRDGMVGLPIILRDDAPPYRVVVRGSGIAFRLRAAVLDHELRQDSGLRDVLLPYSARVVREISQIGFCHHSHNVLQRLSRWLLTAADHLNSEAIQATHESLREAVGTARSGISKALAELQEGEAIWWDRGRVGIRSRPRLEATSCACYRLLREERMAFALCPTK